LYEWSMEEAVESFIGELKMGFDWARFKFIGGGV
jgi:hypothetical protein